MHRRLFRQPKKIDKYTAKIYCTVCFTHEPLNDPSISELNVLFDEYSKNRPEHDNAHYLYDEAYIFKNGQPYAYAYNSSTGYGIQQMIESGENFECVLTSDESQEIPKDIQYLNDIISIGYPVYEAYEVVIITKLIGEVDVNSKHMTFVDGWA